MRRLRSHGASREFTVLLFYITHLEVKERVKVGEHPNPHLVIAHVMHHVRILHLPIVYAEAVDPTRRHRLAHPIQRGCVHRHRIVEILIPPRALRPPFGLGEHVRQLPEMLRSVVGRESREALLGSPIEGRQRNLSQIFLERLGFFAIPIRTIVRGVRDRPRRAVPQMPRRRLGPKEFLHAYDLETRVLVPDLLHVIKILKRKVHPLLVAILAQ